MIPHSLLGRAAGSAVLLFSLSLSPLPAQVTSDGLRPQEKPGLALVKPQAWSKDDQAVVLEFQAFTDRSVKTSPGAGYFEFNTSRSPNYQVPAARVVKIVVYPQVPDSIPGAAARADLQKIIDEMTAVSSKYPAAGRALKEPVEKLKADAAKYDSGFIKENGAWVNRSSYYQQKAAALVELLRPEILAAPKDFDLASNQYFIGLKELATDEPAVRPQMEAMRQLSAAQVRKAQRAEILANLKAPGLSMAQAEVYVGQLKALQPKEDAQSAEFVNRWDSAAAQAGTLTAQITEAQTAFEANFAQPSDPLKVSDEVAAQVRTVASAVQRFRAANPPTVIKVPTAVADGMLTIVDGLTPLLKEIADRQLLDAKAELDAMATKASQIGPNTTAALSVLQKSVAAEIQKFQSLRDEAEMLAQNKKNDEAVKKYQEAYQLVPDKDIEARIEALKKQ